MTITYRYYEGPQDLSLQVDFWTTCTKKLPYAWKPTKSPDQFIKQPYFQPHSRCFAYDGEKCIGYMSFTGSPEFVSLGYPWVLPGYEGDVQDELYGRVVGFAKSGDFGAKMFAQRFRSDWTKQIEYFLSKGFNITKRTPILVSRLDHTYQAHDLEVENGFIFDKWKGIVEKSGDATEEQFAMMKEYYGSVDFDFSLSLKGEGYFGVTLRRDTGYAEILAVAINPNTLNFSKMVESIMKECKSRGAKWISMVASHMPTNMSLKDLGFTEQTEDIMMMKKSDPSE